ncbi:MAG: L-threonylcarbamoyladenylate synthase [Candidatus Dependentiae bacterium]|nr:L-threonylcarbamoyladenylate synthase [Candidatus Dependentiae bacterium]
MLNWKENGCYPLLVDALRHDEVILAASDTVLVLFAQLSEKSKKKLDIIKHRNLKPYIVLIKSADLLHEFIDQSMSESMQQIIDRYWPGPLTIIFKAKSNLPDWMVGVDRTIAIRIPNHEGLQKLLQQVDALFTTSANISDQPIPESYAQINPAILDQVKQVCCEIDKMYDSPSSTIIDFSSGSIKIIRLGAIKIDSI